MTTAKKSFESVKKRADEMTGQRIAQFLMSLEGNLPSVNGVIQWKSLRGKELPATTIDNWLRRAADAGRLDGVSLNRAAFEVWKRLEELGATITGQERRMIVPAPEIESKIARAIEKSLARQK
jgi:hypothetical protein